MEHRANERGHAVGSDSDALYVPQTVAETRWSNLSRLVCAPNDTTRPSLFLPRSAINTRSPGGSL